MTLPILNTPTYSLVIPSTGKSIKFRPFLVKEEKLILIAAQDADGKNASQYMTNAIKQVIINCTFGQVNPDLLTSYDVEYIFLQLKKRSSGSKEPLVITCNQLVTKPGSDVKVPCKTTYEVDFSIDDVKLDIPTNRERKVMLTDTVGMILRDPSFYQLEQLQFSDALDEVEIMYELVLTSIDTIFDGETICTCDTKEELVAFVDSIPTEQFKKIKEYMDSIPKLKADIPVKCKSCGHEEVITLEGLQSFLA